MSSSLTSARVPTLEPAGTVVSGPPRRSLVSRIVARLGNGVVQVFIVAVALIWLFPTVGLFVTSLRPSSTSSATGWWHVFSRPSELTADGYRALGTKGGDILQGVVNSLIITVPTTVLVVMIGALAAYALAWIDFKGRDALFLLVVALSVVPLQMAIIPDAQFFAKLHIFGTFTGVILFHVAFGLPFAVFLLRNFFIGIPRDLLEAARMDGGGEFTIFRRVVLPIGWPAIASLSIFQFVFVWNDLLVALVFSGSTSKPITRVIQEQMGTYATNTDIVSAGAFLSMLVPLAVFFAFQRYYVQGVLAGSVK